MKTAFKCFTVIALAAFIGFLAASCGNPAGGPENTGKEEERERGAPDPVVSLSGGGGSVSLQLAAGSLVPAGNHGLGLSADTVWYCPSKDAPAEEWEWKVRADGQAFTPFTPTPPSGGEVIFIHNQKELAVINSHIASTEHNYGKNAYVLVNDIILTGIWSPLGKNAEAAFSGSFYGCGHSISGLQLPGYSDNNFYNYYNGLFGYTRGALIRDLTITLTGGYFFSWEIALGGAVGWAESTRLKNVGVSKPEPLIVFSAIQTYPQAPNSYQVGGLAGYLDADSEVSGCYSSLDIYAENSSSIVSRSFPVGGLVGLNKGVIKNSYTTGKVTGRAIRDPTPPPSVRGEPYTGGIAGQNDGTISGCFTLGNIAVYAYVWYGNTAYAGGIAGYGPGAIENCAALGESMTHQTPANNNAAFHRIVGGGFNSAALSNNRAYSGMTLENAVVTEGEGEAVSGGADGEGISSRSGSGLLEVLAAGVWEMGASGYPVLKWQK